MKLKIKKKYTGKEKNRFKAVPRGISTVELGNITGVGQSSIWRAVNRNEIFATRTPGGHIRIPIAEAQSYARSRGIDITKIDWPR